MPEFIDSHAHLTSEEVFPKLDEMLPRAKLAGVRRIVNICTNADALQKGIVLSAQHPWIYNVAATTPHDVEKEGALWFPSVAEHARGGKLVAIGETGLDYHYEHSPKEIQKQYLKKYLHLALECALPVVIHCREAFSDFFSILDEEYVVDNKHAPGVLHCFTGTRKEAEEVLNRDWYISLSGIVTFKKSQELRSIAKAIPLNRLLIETDTPYLAPQSHRGKQNEPAYLPEVAAAIAEAKGCSLEEVAQASSENAMSLFRI